MELRSQQLKQPFDFNLIFILDVYFNSAGLCPQSHAILNLACKRKLVHSLVTSWLFVPKMSGLCWLILLFLAEFSSSAKIIGGSAVGGSHYMMIRNVVEELARRGHEV